MEKVNNSDTSMDFDPKSTLKQEIELSDGTVSTPTGTNTPPEFSEPPQFDQARTKTLLRKLDWHLVPFLSLLYLWVLLLSLNNFPLASAINLYASTHNL